MVDRQHETDRIIAENKGIGQKFIGPYFRAVTNLESIKGHNVAIYGENVFQLEDHKTDNSNVFINVVGQ